MKLNIDNQKTLFQGVKLKSNSFENEKDFEIGKERNPKNEKGGKYAKQLDE